MMQPVLNIAYEKVTQSFYPSSTPAVLYTGSGEPFYRISGSWSPDYDGVETWTILYAHDTLEFVFGDIRKTNEHIFLIDFIDSIWPYIRYYWELKSLESLE